MRPSDPVAKHSSQPFVRNDIPKRADPVEPVVHALVLDDDPTTQKILEASLRAVGCEVRACPTPECALSLLENVRYDLVLLDWMMPGDIDGLDVCRKLKHDSLSRDAVVIMVTGRSDPTSLRVALDAGADDYVVKPMSTAMLGVRLQVALRRVREVRERAKLTQERAELTNLLHAVVDNTPDPVFVKDLTGRYRMMNPAGAALVGLTSKEIVGRSDEELFVRETVEEIAAADQRVLSNNGMVTYTTTKTFATGTRSFMINKFPLRDANHQIIALIGMLRDVTEVKQTELALRRSEERFALAAEGSRDGVWDWDLTTGEVFFSSRWRQLAGLNHGDAHGSMNIWLDRVHPSDRALLTSAIEDHLEGRSDDLRYEYRLLHEDGSYHWMQVRAKAIFDDTSRPLRIVGAQSDISDSRRHDPATGLPNRRQFLEQLDGTLRESAEPEPVVMVLRIEGFDAGTALCADAVDRVAIVLGERLLGTTHGLHTVARISDNEFGILLHCPDHQAATWGRRFHQCILDPVHIADGEIMCRASIGIAMPPAVDAEELLRNAYLATKRAPVGGCEVFQPGMQRDAVEQLVLASALRRAIANDDAELWLAFQPVVDLHSGRLTSFEALCRWNHTGRGAISPSEFVRVAEETKQIVALGRRVRRLACRTIGRWRQHASCYDVPVAVNVSADEFAHADFSDDLLGTLRASDLPPSSLRLEVTETGLFDDIEAATATLGKLCANGIEVSIDDFGTGHSSLAYVHRLPATSLKIDRSFVSRLGEDDQAESIVRAILTVAESLGLSVVAEGIETISQWQLLRQLGCQYGQGYLFSRPLPAEHAEQLLMESSQNYRYQPDASWSG